MIFMLKIVLLNFVILLWISKIKLASKSKNNDKIVISTGEHIKRKNTIIRYYFAAAISIYLATRSAQRNHVVD